MFDLILSQRTSMESQNEYEEYPNMEAFEVALLS